MAEEVRKRLEARERGNCFSPMPKPASRHLVTAAADSLFPGCGRTRRDTGGVSSRCRADGGPCVRRGQAGERAPLGAARRAAEEGAVQVEDADPPDTVGGVRAPPLPAHGVGRDWGRAGQGPGRSCQEGEAAPLPLSARNCPADDGTGKRTFSLVLELQRTGGGLRGGGRPRGRARGPPRGHRLHPVGRLRGGRPWGGADAAADISIRSGGPLPGPPGARQAREAGSRGVGGWASGYLRVRPPPARAGTRR